MGTKREQRGKEPHSQWLTTSEAARCLGVSVDKVRELDETGELRASRTKGKHRRFSRKALDAYLSRNRRQNKHKDERPKPRPRPIARPELEPEAFEEDRDAFEPGDEEFETFVEAPPPPPPPANPFEKLAREMAQRKKREAEEAPLRRLTTLKQYGLNQVPYGTPDSWRARVALALENFVTLKTFPDWIDDSQAYVIVRGKVEEILQPYREEVARKKAEEATKEAKARDEHRVQQLIEYGKSYASSQTLCSWESDDRARAVRDVERMLRDDVEADWTEQDVKDAVDDELGEWEDEDDDNDYEDGEEDES